MLIVRRNATVGPTTRAIGVALAGAAPQGSFGFNDLGTMRGPRWLRHAFLGGLERRCGDASRGRSPRSRSHRLRGSPVVARQMSEKMPVRGSRSPHATQPLSYSPSANSASVGQLLPDWPHRCQIRSYVSGACVAWPLHTCDRAHSCSRLGFSRRGLRAGSCGGS